MKGHDGIRISLGPTAAFIYAKSSKQKLQSKSSCESELYTLDKSMSQILAFQYVLQEIGMFDEPAIVYQDNQSAIRIAMNRGSLAKKTRATEIRVFSIRNKVEDMKVVPIYLETSKMLADIGTKALDPKVFCALRDVMCGYANQNILK